LFEDVKLTNPYELSAKETAERVKRGELTAVECVSSVFDRIRDVEGSIHAYVTLMEDLAMKRAREIDSKAKSDKRPGKLAGVCIAVKDNICTKGVRTTCSSRMLENFVPPYDATVVERIIQEDGIIVGKTNMDEFAMGSTTETSYFGPTRNPWNSIMVPGGSSGGSAAAVSTDETVLALGSDTGGSIRCPASFCSVVGLKPTYGLVSRYGLIAYSNSLEQIGPITGSVSDCALLLEVIAGYDERDSTSVKTQRNSYVELLEGGVERTRIGVIKDFLGEGANTGVEKRVWEAVHKLEDLGAFYEEVSIPSLKYTLPAYYLIAVSEASSNLARYDGVRYGYKDSDESCNWSESFSRSRGVGFGPEVRRRMILGTFALSAGYYNEYYIKALKVRTLIGKAFNRAFKAFTVLIGPTMPFPPFKIGEKIKDPLALYLCDVDSVAVNLAGCCAISVPCGFVDCLPVGLQIIGKPFGEAEVLRVAYTFEQNTDHQKKKPDI